MRADRVAWARARYDSAANGAGVGPHVLSGDWIPKGAVIIDTLIRVTTPGDSANDTATIALGVESAADLLTAAVISGAPWSTAGAKRATLTATTAPVTTTARRQITATVAVQALTAGRFTVYVRYLKP
jgi:hypothetical protein